MFERIFNYIKEQKKLEDEYKDMDYRRMKLYCVWQNMLQVKNEIKIITGETEAETEAEYRRFNCELDKMDPSYKSRLTDPFASDQLNEIVSVEAPIFFTEEGKLMIVIRYKYIGLQEGITKEDYDMALSMYHEMDSKINKFKKLHPRIYNKYNQQDEDFI